MQDTSKNLVPIEKILPGRTFRYMGDKYLRLTLLTNTYTYHAVHLGTYDLVSFKYSTMVEDCHEIH